MTECGHRFGFSLEPGQPVRILRECRRQYLDGDLAPEARVPCAVDLAHAARPDRADDFVGTDVTAAKERHELYLNPLTKTRSSKVSERASAKRFACTAVPALAG